MKSKPESWYIAGRIIKVNDKMQTGSYSLTYKLGTNLKKSGDGARYADFEPFYTPKQMLRMGVFEGKYINDGIYEFPAEWYAKAKLSDVADPSLNYFGIKSRLSLQKWQANGWVPVHPKDQDVRGWFQWYCRYYLGRRIPEVDEIQIKRWKAFARHFAQVKKHASGDPTKRPKQRQALLQWSWNCLC